MKLVTEYGIKPHTERIPGYTYSLSYGDGQNSTALIIEIVKRGLPLDFCVFADPGFEDPNTYDFINNHFIHWLVKHNVRLVYVAKYIDGKRETITNYWMKNHRIPDRIYRDCTRRQKIEPIHKFYKHQIQTKKVIEYIGIHAGEPRRIKKSFEPWITKCYPLYEWKIGKDECKKIIEAEGLPVPPKSGCPNCFANKRPAMWKLYKERPDIFEKSIEIEENYLQHKKERGLKSYYYMTIGSKPKRLLDMKKEFENTTTLDVWQDEPDHDSDCIEGCMT